MLLFLFLSFAVISLMLVDLFFSPKTKQAKVISLDDKRKSKGKK